MQAVIRECGFPLAAPSANRSSELSPTTAAHVEKQLGDRIALIVDGGAAQVGIESTVLDLSVHPPRILRPGMVHEESLLAVAGQLATGAGDEERVLKSPGRLRRHYSPKARLVILAWADEKELRRKVGGLGIDPSRLFVVSHTRVPSGEGWGGVSVIPHDAEAFARALYAELYQCDEAGAELIVVEMPPENGEWRAISDRLNRAATSS